MDFEFLRLAGMLLTSHTLYEEKCYFLQFYVTDNQVNKTSSQRTSCTIILLMFENVVNNILFVLLVLFFLNWLVFSHVGRHLEFLELPKGNNFRPPGSYYNTSKRYLIQKKNLIKRNLVSLNGLWLLDGLCSSLM